MHDAMLLAPHAARFHALVTPLHGLAVVFLLLVLCIAAAVAVKVEVQR